MNFDLGCVQLASRLAFRYKWLDWIAIFLAKYLPYLMVVFLLVYFIIYRPYSALFIIFISGFFARFFLSYLINAFYQRKRPFQTGLISPLFKAPKAPSFPSGHAALFFGISFALLVYSLPLAIIYLALTLIMSKARIFCGMHWPSDILGGMAVGALAAFTVIKLCL